MSYYRICPGCGAYLDPGERCDCRTEREQSANNEKSEKKAAQVLAHQDGKVDQIVSKPTVPPPVYLKIRRIASMKADKLSFPLTLEAFVAYQEAGIGRKLGECERKAAAAWVPAFNDAYEDGKRLDYGAIKDSLDKMNSLVSSRETNPKLHRFLSVSRYWIAYAFDRGRADAGKVVGV